MLGFANPAQAGKTVRGPANKKMLMLAGLLAAAAVFVAFGM